MHDSKRSICYMLYHGVEGVGDMGPRITSTLISIFVFVLWLCLLSSGSFEYFLHISLSVSLFTRVLPEKVLSICWDLDVDVKKGCHM